MSCFQLDDLSNPGKLLISFSYNPTLIDAFKSVGCRWSADGRQTNGICKVWWTDKPETMALVTQAYEQGGSAADVHKFLTARRADKIAASFKASSDFAVPVPEGNHPLTGLPFALMPFQRAGVEFAHRRDNALIADEMGLGKSVQAIGIVNCTKEAKRVLVVCPASLKLNWYRELRTWLVNKELTVGIAQGGYWPDTNIVIINYDIAAKHRAAIDSVEWDVVILDEAHYIKSPEAIRTKAIIGGKVGRGEKAQSFSAVRAKRRIALTGTPILNRPAELFSMLHWLDPREWASRFHYARRYCAGGWGMYDGASNLEELQLRLRQSLMIRRLKRDVLQELPAKMRSVIEYEVPELRIELEQEIQDARAREKALAALRAAVELAKASEDPVEYRRAIEALRNGLVVAFNEMAALRKRTAVAKIPHVVTHIKDILASSPEDKVIVFAHHRDVVDAIHAAFGTQAVKLYGGLTPEEKDAAVQRFQNDPTCRVFVGSITAAGVGLTLTAAHRVVFAELDWTPSNVTQCEDRCILEGQLVLTPDGWKPIESVVVGDNVIGSDGHSHKVLDAWSKGCLKPIVELQVEGWPTAIKTTADHPFLIRGRWREAGNLQLGDVVTGPITQSIGLGELRLSIDRTVFAANGRKASAPESIVLDEEALFVFGYFVGDGFASVRGGKGSFISFSGHQKKDAKAFERISAWFGRFGLVGYNHHAVGFGMEMRFYSAEWAAWFKEQFGMYAHGKHLPEWVWLLHRGQQAALLDGLAASDGYNRDGKGRIEYVTASDKLASQVYRLALNCGMSVGKTRQSVASGAHNVISWCSDGTSGKIVGITFRYPKKINGKRERVYDLTVEGTSDFVVGPAVVHNCHRIGQKDTVLVQHIVLAGSLDATIARKLVAKQAVIDRALDEMDKLRADAVIPTEESELDEVARIEDIDLDSQSLTSPEVESISRALVQLSLADHPGSLELPAVDAIIVSRLVALPSLTNRQAALALRVLRKNIPNFRLTSQSQ